MSKGLFLLALGAGALYAASRAAGASATVTGKSGKPWRVALLSSAGDTKTWEVFAPAGSWGPHGEMSVIRYSQKGSDMGSRKLVATGAPVPAEITAAARADFGV